MSEHSYSVGEKVRVVCDLGNNLSRRGMVACHNLDMTYDIIYDNKSEFCKKLLDEEPSVVESRMSSLLHFEVDSTAVPSPSPCEMKEYGNLLYKIRDYDSAIQYYRKSLDTLLPVKVASIGSSVLIQNKKTSSAEFNSAVVSDVNEGLYDVIFDDEALGEEESIDISRVILLANVRSGDTEEQCTDRKQSNNESPVDLQRALYMNNARCNMKKNPPLTGWCVRMASMAIGINRMMLLAHSSSECEEHSVESFSKPSNPLNLKNIENVTQGSSSSYSVPANEQRRVEINEKSEVLRGSSTNPGNNDRIFPDMTGKEISKEVQLIRKQLSDGYYMRCRALLHACRPQLAKQDALELEAMDPPKSRQMIKEIERFLKKRNKSNRKLARDVAEWVDIAVSQSHGGVTVNSVDPSCDTGFGDLEIENDTVNELNDY